MRLLIIEDDAELCNTLKLHLEHEGYDVDVCQNGADADYYIKDSAYGTILLDRMLPEVDGLTILKNMRNMGVITPVLMLTALDAVNDKTDGLDAGADDYLAKPFAMAELLSRVRALLRRPAAIVEQRTLSYSDLTLDVKGGVLRSHEVEVSLSKKETAVLELFFGSPDTVLPRAMILSRVWGGDDMVEEGNIDNYIYFARRRLRAVGGATIQTIHGVGYKLTRLTGEHKNG